MRSAVKYGCAATRKRSRPLLFRKVKLFGKRRYRISNWLFPARRDIAEKRHHQSFIIRERHSVVFHTACPKSNLPCLCGRLDRVILFRCYSGPLWVQAEMAWPPPSAPGLYELKLVKYLGHLLVRPAIAIPRARCTVRQAWHRNHLGQISRRAREAEPLRMARQRHLIPERGLWLCLFDCGCSGHKSVMAARAVARSRSISRSNNRSTEPANGLGPSGLRSLRQEHWRAKSHLLPPR
jgi:hypothetical protein